MTSRSRSTSPRWAATCKIGNTELARFDLTEDASTETAMIYGELYRHGSDWKFRAVGQGYASGLRGIVQDYGVHL